MSNDHPEVTTVGKINGEIVASGDRMVVILRVLEANGKAVRKIKFATIAAASFVEHGSWVEAAASATALLERAARA